MLVRYINKALVNTRSEAWSPLPQALQRQHLHMHDPPKLLHIDVCSSLHEAEVVRPQGSPLRFQKTWGLLVYDQFEGIKATRKR